MQSAAVATQVPKLASILSDPIIPTSLDEKDDHEERQRKGFAFSRSFIVTYQAALVALLLAASLSHALTRWRQRRSVETRRSASHPRSVGGSTRSGHSPSSPSGSTTSGNTQLPKDVERPSERSLLLPHKANNQRTVFSVIRSCLMYQPPRISILGQHPPPFSTILSILLLLALNVFYLLFNALDEIDIFADRAGLLFVANLPWQYLLAAKNQPLKLLTGYSYEELNIFHRRLGDLMCGLAVLHFASMLAAWYQFLRPEGHSLQYFLTLPHVLLGLATFVCYQSLFLTSMARFRDWWYEMFLGSHISLQAGGMIFLSLHHATSRPYIAVSLAMLIIDRIVYRLFVKNDALRANLRLLDDGQTVLVSAHWPVRSRLNKTWPASFGKSLQYGWRPSEHCFLTVPELGQKHIIQSHPFTIASAAPDTGSSHAWFDLVIRGRAGFSRDLVDFAKEHTSANIRLDGPYGSLHALHMLQSSDISVVVAGGSGIAVAYPLVWSLLHDEDRDGEALVISRRVCLIWIIHEAAHVSWLGQERLDELKAKGLHLVVPSPTKVSGRPDVDSLLVDVVEKLNSDGNQQPKVGIMVSGPDGLNKSVRNICSRLAWHGIDIDVAVEKFGW